MEKLESKKLTFGIREAQGIIKSFGWLLEISGNSETREFCNTHIDKDLVFKTVRKMELKLEKLQIEISLTNEMILSLRSAADYMRDLIPVSAKAADISLKQLIRKIDTLKLDENRQNN